MVRRLGIWAVLVLCACAARADGPLPAWAFADYPYRALFVVPKEAGASLLVNVPSESAKGWSAFAACDQAGVRLGHRLIHADAATTAVLVDLGGRSPAQRFSLYCGDAAAVPGGVPAWGSINDTAPINMDVHRPGGQSVPNTWEKMFYLYRMAPKPAESSHVPSFGDISVFAYDGAPRRGRRQPRTSNWLLRLQTYILCPETGSYRFALDSEDACYLVIEGSVAAARLADSGEGKWSRGAPVALRKGVHLLQVFAFSDNRTNLRLGWATPGGQTITEVPATALVTACAAADVRGEHKRRTLQPAFSYEVRQEYSVRGRPDAFIPVLFKNTSADWTSDTMTARWTFDDGTTGEGDTYLHVFTGKGLHKATLEVRDDLGFVATCEQTIDCRLLLPREYAVDISVANLPAVCYPSDEVEPGLRLSGQLPAETGMLQVSWTVTDAAGARTTGGREVTLVPDAPARLTLGKFAAGRIATVSWQVQHRRGTLGAGTIRFLKPPFAALPARIEGDRLYDAAGVQLILVPSPEPTRLVQGRIPTRKALGKLTCIDDFLAIPGLPGRASLVTFDQVLARLVGGPNRPAIKYAPLAPWEQFPNAYGPLVKLQQVPAAIDASTDVAILHIGMADYLEHKDPEVFERQLAALCDLILGSLKCPIVLVTPPPYPPNPADIRPYAAAIRRVATVRQIPVADLFTAFQGMPGTLPRSFFSGSSMTLSQSGQNLAAQVIAKALLAHSQESDG